MLRKLIRCDPVKICVNRCTAIMEALSTRTTRSAAKRKLCSTANLESPTAKIKISSSGVKPTEDGIVECKKASSSVNVSRLKKSKGELVKDYNLPKKVSKTTQGNEAVFNLSISNVC